MEKIKENDIVIDGEKVVVTQTKTQTVDIFGVKNELEKVNRDIDYIKSENQRLKKEFSALKDYKEKLEDVLLKLEQDEIVEDNDDLNLE